MPYANFPISELLTGGGAALLTQVGNWIFGRRSREVKALGDTIGIMAEQQDRFDERLKKTEADLATCHAQHEDCRRETSELRAEIDRLMSGPVAVYTPKKPKP